MKIYTLLLTVLLTGCMGKQGSQPTAVPPPPEASAGNVQSISIFGLNQWNLKILPHGGGSITQGHVSREDRRADIPSGTFRFAELHQALQDLQPMPQGYCSVYFRTGRGLPHDPHFKTSETKLISQLFDEVKAHARQGFSDLDRLWAEKPPVPSNNDLQLTK